MPTFSCYINYKLNPSSIIMKNPLSNHGKSCRLRKKALKENLGFVDAIERFGEKLGGLGEQLGRI